VADFWTHLFDNDYSQRDDIESLAQATVDSQGSTAALKRQVAKLRERVDRNELMIEGIFRTLEKQGTLSLAEFRELMVQIDLEDGREDGKIGGDVSGRAPKCENPDCARPVNPKRDHCIYCGAPLSDEAKKHRRRNPYRR
jgi:hypothetical protein